LSADFNPEEILVMSTFKQRCAVSAQYMMHGLYPMQDVSFKQDVDYLKEKENPLKKNSYERILKNIGEKSQWCPAGPVI